jgi:outer membrane protein assembly factor BamB
LVTLAGPNVVYGSHTGAVVALDAATGRRVWAVRYPSRGGRLADGAPSPRGLAPCLATGGRVYVAPVDYDRILCLDAGTGVTLWESRPVEVVHLLGVAKGRLICTFVLPRLTAGGVPQSGIRAFDADTGLALRAWQQPPDGNLPTFGRGLLAGDYVLWPTLQGLRVLRQEDGQPARALDWHCAGGNLAAQDDYLVVAGLTELFIYAPQARFLEERRKEAGRAGAGALSYYRLALSEIDARQGARALKSLARAESLAGPEEAWQGRRLREVVRTRRHELLLDLAAEAVAAGRWDNAAAFLNEAGDAKFSAAERAEALERLAALWKEAGQPGRAVEVWQGLLADTSLRRGPLPDDPADDSLAETPTLRERATTAVARLIAEGGPAVYRPFEDRARRLLQADDRPEATRLQDLLRRYPNATGAPAAWLRLGKANEDANRPGAAAEAYRQLLRHGADPPERMQALLGLARCYERQQCWLAARQTWEETTRRPGGRAEETDEAYQQARERVAALLERPEYRTAGQAQPIQFRPPLEHVWQAKLSRSPQGSWEFVLAPAEDPTAPRRAPLFLGRGNALTCLDAATGRVCWSGRLTAPPVWVGLYADVVLAGTARSVHALRLEDGGALWEWQAPEGGLSGFRQSAGRLCFLHDGRRVYALDALSGTVLWGHAAPGARLQASGPGGQFQPHFLADADWLLLQTTGGHRLALDSETGRLLHEAGADPVPWAQPPLSLGAGTACLVDGPRSILRLHATDGEEIWRQALRWPSLTGEPAHLIGDGRVLLALVSRNYGWELNRLDPETGRPLWRHPRPHSPAPVAAASVAFDRRAVYFVAKQRLYAVALDDGHALWSQPLAGPDGPWRTLRAADALLVHPLDPQREHMEESAAAALFSASDPLALACLLTRVRAATKDRPHPCRLPLFLFNPADGRLLQRLDFTADGLRAAVQPTEAGLAVVLGDRAWGLAAGRR